MASRYNSERQYLDGGQLLLAFLSAVAICVGFFTAGVYVGKWSNASQSRLSSRSSLSLKPLNNQSSIAGDSAQTPTKKDEARQQLPEQSSSRPSDTTEMEERAPLAEGKDQAFEHGFLLRIPTAGTVAREVVQSLHSSGYISARIKEPNPDSASQQYEIEIGPYSTRYAAESAAEQLRAKGMKDVRVITRASSENSKQ